MSGQQEPWETKKALLMNTYEGRMPLKVFHSEQRILSSYCSPSSSSCALLQATFSLVSSILLRGSSLPVTALVSFGCLGLLLAQCKSACSTQIAWHTHQRRTSFMFCSAFFTVASLYSLTSWGVLGTALASSSVIFV